MIHYDTEKQKDRFWLKENEFCPRFELKTESVFAQCNGYMGVRAAHPLSVLEENRGMFLCGAFDKAYEDEVTELVNCPDITWFGIEIEGENIHPEGTKLLSCTRKLDMFSGELHISYLFELKSGTQVQIINRRFASKDDIHLFVQELQISFPDGGRHEVRIKTGINGQRTNSGVSHFRKADCRVYDRRQMEMRGELSDNAVTVLSECSFGKGDARSTDFVLGRRCIHESVVLNTDENGKAAVEKITYVSQSEDRVSQENRKAAVTKAAKEGYAILFRKHAEAMNQFWDTCSLKIDGISEEEEAAICFAQYHIQGMTPWHTNRSSIAAKGLTGEGYKGHVFWDTELFIFPSLLFTYPKTARQLLEFRYYGLDGARNKAKSYGFSGAMFPWEAAKSGEEETPLYAALNIYTGKANKVWSGIKEYHVTADIVYALNQYYEVTEDQDFMDRYGYEIAFEAAQFWASCAKWDANHEKYGIYDVIGPDEYTEHIDNNAYTNYMAAYCVKTAKRYAEDIQQKRPEIYKKLDRMLDLHERLDTWKEFLELIYLPVPNDEGIIPQDDTFLSKPVLENIEKYKKSQVKQAVLLDYSRDEVVDMQVLKQADVVMLLNLFPHMISEQLVRKNVLFYESRTIHDSSLSYCAHAQACASIGAMDLAEDFFAKSLVIDIDDNPYDSTDGIHSASLGGVWNCLVFGFAGIHYEGETLYVRPHMPENWKSVEFKLEIAGEMIRFCITSDKVSMRSVKEISHPIKVDIGGQEYLFTGELDAEPEGERKNFRFSAAVG